MGAIHFGSETYSREELVAELGSAFCCATLGLDNSLLDNSASYIAGWLSSLKSDPRAIVVAASQVQKAADYIRGASYL
jgi:antirestriction protein ArdC